MHDLTPKLDGEGSRRSELSRTVAKTKPKVDVCEWATLREEAVEVSPADFIRGVTRLQPVPLVPELALHQANEATTLWEMTEAELGRTNLPPPFWAFAWAGGQALARHLLDNPSLVRGKTVLDVASGSGLVALAAARAGAAHVIANDIDPFAVAAIAVNAAANGVTIETIAGDMAGQAGDWDVVLAGDVSYERDMAARLSGWLGDLARRGATVLLGDPGRSYLDRTRLEAIASYDVPVPRTLEDADVKRASVWRFRKYDAP